MVDKKLFTETFQYFDKSVIIEIIDIFINESPDRLNSLEQNINDGDFKMLRFNAHSLKGVVANFASQPAFEKVKSLERSAADFMETEGEGFNKDALLQDLNIIRGMIAEMITDLTEIKAQ
jgi:hypothetical protein